MEIKRWLTTTYNETFVTDGCWEVSIKGDSVVVRIIPLVSDNVLQKHSLVSQNLRQPTASTGNYEQRAKAYVSPKRLTSWKWLRHAGMLTPCIYRLHAPKLFLYLKITHESTIISTTMCIHRDNQVSGDTMFPCDENGTVAGVQDLPLDQRMRSNPTHEGRSVIWVLVLLRRNSEIASASGKYLAGYERRKGLYITLTSWWTYFMYISSRPIRRI